MDGTREYKLHTLLKFTFWRVEQNAVTRSLYIHRHIQRCRMLTNYWTKKEIIKKKWSQNVLKSIIMKSFSIYIQLHVHSINASLDLQSYRKLGLFRTWSLFPSIYENCTVHEQFYFYHLIVWFEKLTNYKQKLAYVNEHSINCKPDTYTHIYSKSQTRALLSVSE